MMEHAVTRKVFEGHRELGHRHMARWLFWGFCAAAAAIGLFTANGLITSVSFLALPLIVFLVWRQGEPPVLLFACTFQWLQTTAAVFYTNEKGVTLEEAFGSYELTVATWLSIIGVVALAAGIRCAFLGAGKPKQIELEREAANLDVRKIGTLYIAAFIFSTLILFVARHFWSASQIIGAFASAKWAAVFLLCYTTLYQRRGYALLIGCLCLEFAFGLFGIFSDFKSVFFVLIVAALSSPAALRGRRLAAMVVCMVVLLITGVAWSSIKTEYREFLVDELSGPEEIVPVERKFDKLSDLVQSITWENFTDGFDTLVLRVSYVNFFALTLENVPTRVPYEDGALWKDAVTRVFMPRVLFPDKSLLDDSERTRMYTGVNVAGMESNTSIGIGYFGESYIDFGPIFMFVPIFLLGVFYGLINRLFITRTRHKLLGSAFAVAVLIFNAYAVESSNAKLFGGTLSVTLACVAMYVLFGSAVMRFLRRAEPAPLAWLPATRPQAQRYIA
jgi:hypothetical protein